MLLTKGMVSSWISKATKQKKPTNKTKQKKKPKSQICFKCNSKRKLFVCFNSSKVTNGKRQAYNTILTIQIHYLIPRLTKEMKLFTAFLGKKKKK